LPSFKSHTVDDTIAFGTTLGALLGPGDVLLLSGDLGAGKTQFAKGVGTALGVEEDIISPTFNILLVHLGTTLTLNHWDLYRLGRAEDLDDIDYFAQVASDAVSLVEWGDRFADTALDADLDLRFRYLGEHERDIEVTPLSARGEVLNARLARALEAEGLRDGECNE